MNAPAKWLDERRAQAANRFAAQGMPHRRIEDWKYSDLKTALRDEPIPTDDVLKWTLDTLPSGVEMFDLAMPDGAPDWVQKHFGCVSKHDAMSSASLALGRSGIAIRVPAGVVVDEPVRLSYLGSGHGRFLLVIEARAQVTLVETSNDFYGQSSNVGSEIVVGNGALLTHVRVASRHKDILFPSATTVDEVAATVARDATYRVHLFTEGGGLARYEFQISLAGANASAHLSGVSVLGDGAHADVTTHITHAVAHTTSTQLFKKVAGGKSRGVYQGRITVEQGADKSDSRQTAKALLMGIRAEADLKPELEIFADDVKCAHGAAVGDLDPNSLFYLRARGIPEAEARNMLVRAFLEEAVDEIADETIRETVWREVEKALPKAMLP